MSAEDLCRNNFSFSCDIVRPSVEKKTIRMKQNDGKPIDPLFKAMIQVACGTFALIVAWVGLGLVVALERSLLSDLIVFSFFIAVLALMCAVVVLMTLGGRNIFSLPLALISRLFGRNLQHLRTTKIPPAAFIVLLTGFTAAVTWAIAWKLPDVNRLTVLSSAALYLASTLALWWRLRRTGSSAVLSSEAEKS